MRPPLRIGIFGGCFNPVHCAHLRAALEAAEGLGLDRVDFVPSARPPHKPDAPMLGFAARLRLLRAAVADMPGLAVNDLESRRPGPSYTYDTLVRYREDHPGAELFFIMGTGDLLNLATWRRGFELPRLAHLAVLGREGLGGEEIGAYLAGEGAGIGATARSLPPGVSAGAAWAMPGGHMLFCLEIPRLDISASLVRERWRCGRTLRFLAPDAVLQELASIRDEADLAWGRPPAAAGPPAG
jgi:nicotinate-nucleotide adenylyltransferase